MGESPQRRRRWMGRGYQRRIWSEDAWPAIPCRGQSQDRDDSDDDEEEDALNSSTDSQAIGDPVTAFVVRFVQEAPPQERFTVTVKVVDAAAELPTPNHAVDQWTNSIEKLFEGVSTVDDPIEMVMGTTAFCAGIYWRESRCVDGPISREELDLVQVPTITTNEPTGSLLSRSLIITNYKSKHANILQV